MKRLRMGIAAAILVMAIGAAGAYAAAAGKDVEGSHEYSPSAFEDMLPHARQMHPDLSEENIREMHNDCHSGKGMGTQGMMKHI